MNKVKSKPKWDTASYLAILVGVLMLIVGLQSNMTGIRISQELLSPMNPFYPQ